MLVIPVFTFFAVADGPPPVPIQRCPPNQYILVTQHALTK